MCSLLIFFCFVLVVAQTISRAGISVQDKNRMIEHLQGTVNFESLTEGEMRFHYFMVRNIEGYNKLDGCEILQSVMHFHSKASITLGIAQRIFTDSELSLLDDPLLESDDKNFDGFIDYKEFVEG